MAKEKRDPAFLFYDGDAARDVSHMDRLERGAYFDLIQAQKKFHGYSMEQVRKILGKDFESTWNALELILEQENGVYFIPWLRISLEERAQKNETQRKRIQKYWDKVKNRGNTVEYTTEIPPEDENEICIRLLALDSIDSEEAKILAMVVIEMMAIWMEKKPDYRVYKEADYNACLNIAYHIGTMKKMKKADVVGIKESEVLHSWKKIVDFVCVHSFYTTLTLTAIAAPKMFQRVENSMREFKNSVPIGNGIPAEEGLADARKNFKSQLPKDE